MKKLIEKFILLISGMIIGFLLIEIFLYIIDKPKVYNPPSSPYQFIFNILEGDEYYYTNLLSSNIKFTYGSNPRGYFDKENAVYHRINSLGFRGKEFVSGKDKNTVKVAFLGDSFTFGSGVKDEDIFPKKLISLLNKHNNDTGIHFEEFNFGMPAYNTELSLTLLKNVVMKFKPEIMVLSYTLNDAEPKNFFIDKSGAITVRARDKNKSDIHPYIKPPLTVFKSRTAQLVWQFFSLNRIRDKTIKDYNSLYQEENQDWAATKNSLRQIRDICDMNKMTCYVLCFPLFFQLDESYPFQNIHSIIEREVMATDYDFMHFIDLFPYFKGMKDIDLWVHPTDQHPNELAHAIVANAIFQIILDDFRNRKNRSEPSVRDDKKQ